MKNKRKVVAWVRSFMERKERCLRGGVPQRVSENGGQVSAITAWSYPLFYALKLLRFYIVPS